MSDADRSPGSTQGWWSRHKVAIAATASTIAVAAVTSVVLKGVDAGVSTVTEKVREKVNPSPSPTPPLAVQVQTDGKLASRACQGEYIDAKPESVLYDPSRDGQQPDPHIWGKRFGGVDAGTTVFRVTVQGTGDEAVVLNGLTVNDKSAPLTRRVPVYAFYEGCGGQIDERGFEVNLDERPATVKPNLGSPDFPLKVTQSDPEVLVVTAYTDSGGHSWTMDLDWTSGARRGQVTIDDAGTSFQTIAERFDGPQYFWDWAKRQWQEVHVSS